MKLSIKLLLTVLIIAAVAFFIFLLIKGVTSKAAEQNTRIVIVFKSLNDGKDYWDVVRAGSEAAAKEFGVKIEFVGPANERDITKQIEITKNEIQKKPSAIILAANDYNSLVPAAREVEKAGIKLITIDSGINSDIPDSFIATDNVQAGRKAGRQLADLVGKNSKIGIVSHVKGTATAIEREKGVREGVALQGTNRIMDTLYCDNNMNIAYSLVKNMLAENPDIKGIACLNQITTLGAASAVKELGLGGKIKIVGFDSAIDEVKLLEEGIIQATVVQKPFTMGYKGVEMAVRAIAGEKVNKYIDTDSVLVTKANMYDPENEKLLFPFIDK